MSEYLLLIYGQEKLFADQGPALWDEVMKGHNAFSTRYGDKIKGGNALQSVETATSVRGDGPVTDGPFAETKEALGGYYVVEAADLDEAVEMARAIPSPGGGVEVRPVMVFD